VRLNVSATKRFGGSNGFSKEIDWHAAAVSLHVAFYNLCRSHEVLLWKTRAAPLNGQSACGSFGDMQKRLEDHERVATRKPWRTPQVIVSELRDTEAKGTPSLEVSPFFSPSTGTVNS
jgi:hypothetical protein